jgi:hypothetical protein
MRYNKEELFSKIERLSVKKIGNTVVTYYDDEAIRTVFVSPRYEIFDIVKYLKDKILLIESNFEIKEYSLVIKGGIQYLQLYSDEIEIDGKKYLKMFNILNSTDKTRKLSFNTGLYCASDNYFLVAGDNDVALTKRHTTGVTNFAETATKTLDGETFNEQIEALESLVGHKVAFSKVRELILGDKEEIPQVNHKKFDSFRNAIYWDIQKNLSDDNRKVLCTRSTYLKKVEKKDDFYIDAFNVLRTYLILFKKEDSSIIKNETERIMKITQCAVRNDLLEMLGI